MAAMIPHHRKRPAENRSGSDWRRASIVGVVVEVVVAAIVAVEVAAAAAAAAAIDEGVIVA